MSSSYRKTQRASARLWAEGCVELSHNTTLQPLLIAAHACMCAHLHCDLFAQARSPAASRFLLSSFSLNLLPAKQPSPTNYLIIETVPCQGRAVFPFLWQTALRGRRADRRLASRRKEWRSSERPENDDQGGRAALASACAGSPLDRWSHL